MRTRNTTLYAYQPRRKLYPWALLIMGLMALSSCIKTPRDPWGEAYNGNTAFVQKHEMWIGQ